MTGFTKRLSACLLSTALILSLSCNVLATDDTVTDNTDNLVSDLTVSHQSEENGVDSSIDVCFYLRPRTQGSIIISPIYHSDHHRL